MYALQSQGYPFASLRIIVIITGRLEASYVGPGNASEAAAGKAVVSRRRTSQNMMMDDFMTTRNPKTARIVKSLHTKSLNLFAAGADTYVCWHLLTCSRAYRGILLCITCKFAYIAAVVGASRLLAVILGQPMGLSCACLGVN